MSKKDELAAVKAQIAKLADVEDLSDEQADELKALLDKRDRLALQVAAEAERVAQAAADDAALRDEIKAQLIKEMQPDNDPGFATGVNVTKNADVAKYDHYSIEDLAFASDLAQKAVGRRDPGIVKALALRLDSSEVNEDKPLLGKYVSPRKSAQIAMREALKRANVKADELNYSTNAGYGDEWIGVGYSGNLWEAIRVNTFVVDKLNPFEFPPGVESLVIPLESTDPVWYTIAEAADPGATTQLTYTVPAKAMGTSNATMTLAKLGTSVMYTGEMVEGSVLPFVAQLRQQIAVSGAEYLESAIIDGDTATTTATNINDIAGTPSATDWFMVWDGFRKSPLITTTANSRDGGILASGDYLETVKLMGGSGINALDRSKVGLIIDPSTHYKSLELADVKTRDVFGGATIEGGQLTGIFGYGINVSGQICKASAVRLSNSAGKVDQDTTTNNTKGSILAVRYDQWRLGFRRRMTLEVERIPRADSWQITAIMRAGLKQRDTEASAISYNITV